MTDETTGTPPVPAPAAPPTSPSPWQTTAPGAPAAQADPFAKPAAPPAPAADVPPAPPAPAAPAPAPTVAPVAAAPAAPPAPPTPPAPPAPSVALRSALADVRLEVAKAVVGQDAAVSGLVIALLCRGHVLLEGVPGVAKTLLVRSLSAALHLSTKRVQFTPDLMPGDVTGSLVYDARTAEFSFREGPVFTNLLLADEINRTPPKTQASLLEAMEERQVSVDGTPRPLPDPFLVIATQNPVEYEGTYPLPEAQLDRFLLKLTLPLPERAEEVEVLARHAGGFDPRDLGAAGVRPVADEALLAAARAEVARVQVSQEVLGYVVDVCRATRRSPSLALGVSPRGATALLATARAWAWLSGRAYVTPDDVKALAHPTLRHRVQLRAEAELEGVTTESVLDTVLGSVPVPR
ncbi:AAA family ATPase [Cellulomonas biazotea]|uniref:AAA family ATPase n=1 Tax=Cellulomonas biazotea TaxID=1709 RepID=UPI00406BA2AD